VHAAADRSLERRCFAAPWPGRRETGQQRLVDRLVAHAHLRTGWVMLGQPAGDLFRRPVLLKLGSDELPQCRSLRQQARLRAPGAPPGTVVGVDRSIVARPLFLATSRVIVEADRPKRRRSPDRTRPRPDPRDLLALIQAQRVTAPSLRGLVDAPKGRRIEKIEPGGEPPPGDLADRIPSLPPLPYFLAPI